MRSPRKPRKNGGRARSRCSVRSCDAHGRRLLVIDVALASLIEDMIEKAGADGVVEFWERVGDNLAGRMGKEAYLGWTSFNVAVREARTAFSIEGEVTPLTDMAITDVDGDVVGYLYAMRQCCYVPTIFRTRYAVGRMSPADKAVTDEYNENVHNIAVCNFCVFHERFREEIAKNITVSGNPLACFLLATRGWSGETKLSPKDFEEVRPVTDHCMSTYRSPFERGWREYAKRVGAFSPVHREVAEYYNHKVRPTAVTSIHVVLHTFREAAAARVNVGKDGVRYEPVASAWVDGNVQVPEGPKLESLLKRAGISRTRLGMLMRNHSDVWLLEPA